MLQTRTLFFVISFFFSLGLSVLFGIPLLIYLVQKYKKKQNEFSAAFITLLIVSSYLSLIFLLFSILLLSVFSYIPFWASGIIISIIIISISAFWLYKSNFKMNTTNVLAIASFICLIIIFWLTSWLTQHICFTSSPKSFSFYATRTDFCKNESNLPCHVYLTFGTNTSSQAIIHFQSSYKYDQPIVYYGTSPGHNDPSQYPFSYTPSFTSFDISEIDRYIYYAFLNDLEPNTDYYFSVGFINEDNIYIHLNERKFKTTPAHGSYNFIAGGDMGINEDVGKLIKVGAQYEPYFAAIGGDIAYDNNFPGCYSRLDAFMKIWTDNAITPNDYTIPMITAIGNHEAGGFGMSNSIFYTKTFVHEKFENAKDIKSYHPHYISDSLLLSLDSSVLSTNDEQVPFIEEELSKYTGNYLKMAIYHVPLYPSVRTLTTKWSTLSRNIWGPLFDKYKLTLGLENHDHAYKRSPLIRNDSISDEGTLYVGDGCWGTNPRNITVSEEQWWLEKALGIKFVLVVDVQDGYIDIKALDQNSNEFDSFQVYYDN